MNSIIIDDENTAREIIKKLCSEAKDVNFIAEFDNGLEAISFLSNHEIDLIFLDIHLPGFTGFDFVRTLNGTPKVILTSSDVNFAIAAYEYDCIVDYLVKPITQNRFNKSIDKVRSLLTKDLGNGKPGELSEAYFENDLYINIDRKLIKIDINTINIVEAKGDYIYLKTDKSNFIVHSSLKKIQDKLPEKTFLKVHRSFIVNLKKIDEIEENFVYVGKTVVPVSRANKKELFERLNVL